MRYTMLDDIVAKVDISTKDLSSKRNYRKENK